MITATNTFLLLNFDVNNNFDFYFHVTNARKQLLSTPTTVQDGIEQVTSKRAEKRKRKEISAVNEPVKSTVKPVSFILLNQLAAIFSVK